MLKACLQVLPLPACACTCASLFDGTWPELALAGLAGCPTSCLPTRCLPGREQCSEHLQDLSVQEQMRLWVQQTVVVHVHGRSVPSWSAADWAALRHGGLDATCSCGVVRYSAVWCSAVWWGAGQV